MIDWIVTLVYILLILYYVRYTYYYYHKIEKEEKVKFPIGVVLLAIFVSCIPIARYLALIGLIIVAPITIAIQNGDSYDKIRVKGFLSKGI